MVKHFVQNVRPITFLFLNSINQNPQECVPNVSTNKIFGSNFTLYRYKPGLYDITRLEKDKIFIYPPPKTETVVEEENDPDLKKAIELSLLEAKREQSSSSTKNTPTPSTYVQETTYQLPEYPKIEPLPMTFEVLFIIIEKYPACVPTRIIPETRYARTDNHIRSRLY